MCENCGCGNPDTPDAIVSDHDAHHHYDEQAPVRGHHTHSHAHGPTSTMVIEAGRALLEENDRFAAMNRRRFDANGTRCFNLISAPGSGKTTLLENTIGALRAGSVRCAVIEGDQATDLDARRIARTGVPVVQIETGRSCHLDAHQVQHALDGLVMPPHAHLFIENVGNLICPTEFKLGEHERVTIMSVPEGHDKPAKYPLAFRTATAVVISKMDLITHVDFDFAEARRLIHGLNPNAPIFALSARTGEGMDRWLEWLQSEREAAHGEEI